MAEQRDKYFVRGISLFAVGLLVALVGALWAHFTGAAEVDDVGREIFPLFPRGWGYELIGQLVSLAGIFAAMGGIALAFLYEKKMTWARSAIGAFLFTSLSIILFGIIPNQWLTYTQAVWEWTPQKLWITIPSGLIGGNEVSLSAAAVKDIVSGTYVVVAIVALGAAMIAYQRRDEIIANRAKKKEAAEGVSAYGRPLQKVER